MRRLSLKTANTNDMSIENEIKDYCDEEAISDLEWFNSEIAKILDKSRESYIGINHVYIYINNIIGFVALKKHKYNEYNKASLIFGNMERDKMLEQKRKTFNKESFIKLIENHITMIVRSNFIESRKRKAIQKENKRKRIPIKIK